MQWNCMYLFLNHLTVVVYYWRNQKVSVIRLVLIIGIFVWLFTAIHIFYRCTTLIDDHIQIVCLLLLPYPFGETTFLFSLFVNKLEQKRNDNSGLNFYREWAAFRDGFGHIEADFWLGNEALHNLTKAVGNILLKKTLLLNANLCGLSFNYLFFWLSSIPRLLDFPTRLIILLNKRNKFDSRDIHPGQLYWDYLLDINTIVIQWFNKNHWENYINIAWQMCSGTGK